MKHLMKIYNDDEISMAILMKSYKQKKADYEEHNVHV